MIEKRTRKIFDFNNEEANKFLILNKENNTLNNSPKFVSKSINDSLSIWNISLRNDKNLDDKFTSPKHLNKIKCQKKFNEEKKQKFNYESELSLRELGIGFKGNYSKSNINKLSFIEIFSQTEIKKKEFSEIIEKSINEIELLDNRLLFLGCQITPDINKNNTFSSFAKPENKSKKNEKFSNNEKKVTENNTTSKNQNILINGKSEHLKYLLRRFPKMV